MRSITHQKGASITIWLLLIGLLGFAVVIGFRLFPIYLESYSVEKILEDVANDSRSKKRNKNQIWSSIGKRFDINNIRNVTKEHFSFKREKGKTTISIAYEVRTKLVGNLDGIVTFEKTQVFDS